MVFISFILGAACGVAVVAAVGFLNLRRRHITMYSGDRAVMKYRIHACPFCPGYSTDKQAMTNHIIEEHNELAEPLYFSTQRVPKNQEDIELLQGMTSPA